MALLSCLLLLAPRFAYPSNIVFRKLGLGDATKKGLILGRCSVNNHPFSRPLLFASSLAFARRPSERFPKSFFASTYNSKLFVSSNTFSPNCCAKVAKCAFISRRRSFLPAITLAPARTKLL